MREKKDRKWERRKIENEREERWMRGRQFGVDKSINSTNIFMKF